MPRDRKIYQAYHDRFGEWSIERATATGRERVAGNMTKPDAKLIARLMNHYEAEKAKEKK